MRINSDVTVGTNKKKEKAAFKFPDLYNGIWYCVDKMNSKRQVYAVVFSERESHKTDNDDDRDYDTYDKYPKVLIICKEPDFNQAFVPNHSAWEESAWKLCDTSVKINVSFEHED